MRFSYKIAQKKKKKNIIKLYQNNLVFYGVDS
jgi:hypothetical protein